MKIEIRFLGGARAGQQVELPDQDSIRFGRRPDNDVVFDVQQDLDVSGHHAEMIREGDGYFLRDVGSANGTFVSGHRITRLRVASGQEIAFGQNGPRIVVRFVDDLATLATDGSPPAASPAAPAPAAAPPLAARDGAIPPAAAVAPEVTASEAGLPAAPVTPGQAAAAAMGGDRKVGARTVAMMIDAALQKTQEKKGGMGKSTVFLRSMMGQAVTRGTRRFKIITAGLLVLLLGAVGGFVGLRHVERREAKESQERLRQEMAAVMEQQRTAASAEKTRLAEKLDQLNRKLQAASPAASGKDIVARNRKAVFLMAYEQKGGEPTGYCTAFAVRRRVLATNAHCVLAFETYRKQGFALSVVMNQEPSRRYAVLKVTHHPDYHKPQRTISHDVGLLLLSGEVSDVVQMAELSELRELSAGDVMYAYGFPGRLANPRSPDATLVQGVIGRVTKLDGELGVFEENKLIQHSAFTSGGTSGSPVFGQSGKVIAVNTGGYVEPGSMQVMDPTTGRAGNLVVAKQLAGYNFGIRIDVVRGLLDQLKE
jgi:pSer/pThr/pTyr-binding forkhead associated (FHA) protein/V8-like Glu-specific endopeptidase